mmetsp:Transcript_18462/g.58313  ORF Transcript_18462/g.58313 Transcript_18462/m.58313 type:complete len:312 (-) Transcript_18462:421-1356(-)
MPPWPSPPSSPSSPSPTTPSTWREGPGAAPRTWARRRAHPAPRRNARGPTALAVAAARGQVRMPWTCDLLPRLRSSRAARLRARWAFPARALASPRRPRPSPAPAPRPPPPPTSRTATRLKPRRPPRPLGKKLGAQRVPAEANGHRHHTPDETAAASILAVAHHGSPAADGTSVSLPQEPPTAANAAPSALRESSPPVSAPEEISGAAPHGHAHSDPPAACHTQVSGQPGARMSSFDGGGLAAPKAALQPGPHPEACGTHRGAGHYPLADGGAAAATLALAGEQEQHLDVLLSPAHAAPREAGAAPPPDAR